MNIAFRGGAAQDPAGKGGLANLMSGLLDEGAGDLDSRAFQAKLEDLSVEMSFDAGCRRLLRQPAHAFHQRGRGFRPLPPRGDEAALRRRAGRAHTRPDHRQSQAGRIRPERDRGATLVGGAVRRPSLWAADRGDGRQRRRADRRRRARLPRPHDGARQPAHRDRRSDRRRRRRPPRSKRCLRRFLRTPISSRSRRPPRQPARSSTRH